MTRGSYVCGSINILLGHGYAKEAIRREFFPGHGTSVPSSLKNADVKPQTENETTQFPVHRTFLPEADLQRRLLDLHSGAETH